MTKQTKNQIAKAQQLQQELQHFMGDLVRYRQPLNRRVIYTPGVRHVAEKAEAYWLIDAIASWISSESFNEAAEKSPLINAMHFWELNVNRSDNTAVLHAEVDVGVEPFIVQSIPFTDFPLDKISIWAAFDGSYWTLYLPSEH